MGLMAVAAEINAQETTDNAEKRAKETVNKKQPNYPMKEVSGTIYDAATGKPLSGVQIQALGNARYAAMTNEDGTFTIKVPTFTTSITPIRATRDVVLIIRVSRLIPEGSSLRTVWGRIM